MNYKCIICNEKILDIQNIGLHENGGRICRACCNKIDEHEYDEFCGEKIKHS